MFQLGINTGFAVNRYAEPEEWTRIVGDELGIRQVQFTADMLNPDLPASIVASQVKRIQKACDKYQTGILSTFTGGFTRVNHLAHPDREVREHWIEWFKRFIDLSVDLGAESMGSHFGIFTKKDNDDPKIRAERRKQNIDAWHIIGAYAKQKGLKFLTWEPMSISREQGETIEAARVLQTDVNKGSPIPFFMCLDVDHGDLVSRRAEDTNPYAWLMMFSECSPYVHIKQSSADKGGHWPFTKKYNQEGRILPEKVLAALKATRREMNPQTLFFEMSFREREPVDSTVVEALRESTEYWRNWIKE